MGPISRSLFRIATTLLNLILGVGLVMSANDPGAYPKIVSAGMDSSGMSFLVMSFAMILGTLKLAKLAQRIGFFTFTLSLISSYYFYFTNQKNSFEDLLFVGIFLSVLNVCILFITIGINRFLRDEIARQ